MRLTELIAGIQVLRTRLAGDPEITGVTNDSRKVAPGSVFVCVRGYKDDGHRYVGDALRNGAVAVVTEYDPPLTGADANGVGAPDGQAAWSEIRVADSREALAYFSAAFYGYPSSHLSLYGVTGTNGKTTIAYMIEAVMAAAGKSTGLIGTVETRFETRHGRETLPPGRTTPESSELQATLHRMVEARVTHVAMEASSHALELKRVVACEFDVAIFTNITHDHFDFHDNFEKYLEAKSKLFRELGVNRTKSRPCYAVINADDPSAPHMVAETKHAGVLTFGLDHPADVRAVDIHDLGIGSEFTVQVPSGLTQRVRLQLPGRFNVSNALSAMAVAYGDGIDLGLAARALGAMTGVAGRYQLVNADQDFTVMVDFAHNPDALEQILKFGRRFTKKKLYVVFGCEGAKDKKKRPIMGRIAAHYADHAIITSDNLYNEDAMSICRTVADGFRSESDPCGTYDIIPNRREAIERALDLAETGDMVIIAGKGHETYQVIGDLHIPFDDTEVAREIIVQKLGRKRAAARAAAAGSPAGRQEP